MKFAKYEATGNDFIIIEDLNCNFTSKFMSDVALCMCDRHFGIGADGAIFVRNTQKADIEMVIINSDGSYASMCGNGIRCFVKYVFDRSIVKKNIVNVLTGDGIKNVELSIENKKLNSIKVKMAKLDFNTEKMSKVSQINNMDVDILGEHVFINSMFIGVPHTVILNRDFNLNIAKEIEKYYIFKEGTNVNFCNVIDDNNIEVKTYERGAGITLSCGTGSCACFAVCFRNLLVNSEINIKLLGGAIKASIKDDIMYMIGNANFICEGIFAFSEGRNEKGL